MSIIETKNPVRQHGEFQRKSLQQRLDRSHNQPHPNSQGQSLNKSRYLEAKEHCTIPETWERIGYELPRKWSECHSPWREDRKPSFSVFNHGRAYQDFATGEKGSVIDFVMKSLSVEKREAVDWILGDGFTSSIQRKPFIQRTPRAQESTEPAASIDFSEYHQGRHKDWQALHELRGFSMAAIEAALSYGTLCFGEVLDHSCWILTDPSAPCAEARRLDGGLFYGERKVHTLRGARRGFQSDCLL